MTDDAVEDLEHFRQRARAFVEANLQPVGHDISTSIRGDRDDAEELAAVARDREVQRMLFEAGLAGVCFPKEYGGQGLTPAHQAVLNEELFGREYASHLQSPSISQCAAVLLDFGTEEQKRRHLPAILRGDEIWMQFLSEPGCGSDVAGATTTAVRDGDEWILNGSKIWTTGAWWSDWALCLARTNWDVPKHRGLTVFIVPVDAPGVEMHRIEMLSGSREFCQEFLTDVRIPDSYRIGEVDDGWTVGIRWMYHERLGSSSPYATMPGGAHPSRHGGALSMARDLDRLDDPVARDRVGEAHVLETARDALIDRVSTGMRAGTMSDQSAALGRLFAGVVASRVTTIILDLAGTAGIAWEPADGIADGVGTDFLVRQAYSIAGGTLEMARNVISERVLGMPRERTLDKDVPFRDVPRSGKA